jgi:hypothetical protein
VELRTRSETVLAAGSGAAFTVFAGRHGAGAVLGDDDLKCGQT